jgi:hypothetical protein
VTNISNIRINTEPIGLFPSYVKLQNFDHAADCRKLQVVLGSQRN